MFRYTPNKKLLRDMQVSKTGRWWDKEYFKKTEILNKYDLPQDGIMIFILGKHFMNVDYYSRCKLKQIPVMGRYFPVEMFNEEIY